MNVAIPIFDHVTALDAVGPYEVLSRLPGTRVCFVASSTGPKRTENGMLALTADATLQELPDPEVIVVPGGFGTRELMRDESMLGWLRAAHETSVWTTSVCTGSLLLAAAGILDGLEATTHWMALETLAEHGARPVARFNAASANSPFVDGRDSGLASARTQIFTKSFPRCGVPDSFGGWDAYRRYIEFLVHTRSIVEYTQVWWSVRPHFAFGTVELRICDAQATSAESEALAALMVACIAQAARDLDEGRPLFDPEPRMIEENMWRAIRFGLDGRLIDLEKAEEYPATGAAERLAAWTEPVRAELGLEAVTVEGNGAQRQRRMLEAGASMEDVFAASVRETRESYPEEVPV